MDLDINAIIRNVLNAEAQALLKLALRVDSSFEDAASLLHSCEGKVVVIGMGKCSHIAQKMSATFASTGTRTQFVHPAEAIHGDLGYIDAQDVALVLSNSGETEEITALLPNLKSRSIPFIALTGNAESTLARQADIVLDIAFEGEADPLNLVPTTSTTAMLAVGDALAVALMELNSFTREDFARSHPGGNLGQKLLCRVDELMHTGDAIPRCGADVLLRDALVLMTSKRLGTAIVMDDGGCMLGILTDGDIRRIFQNENDPLNEPVSKFMTTNPQCLGKAGQLAADALRDMETKLKSCMPILDEDGRVVGALHIHDLVRAGIGDFPDFLKS